MPGGVAGERPHKVAPYADRNVDSVFQHRLANLIAKIGFVRFDLAVMNSAAPVFGLCARRSRLSLPA